jgi:hypothetical protein
VDSVSDPPLLIKYGSAGNRTQDLWISSRSHVDNARQTPITKQRLIDYISTATDKHGDVDTGTRSYFLSFVEYIRGDTSGEV